MSRSERLCEIEGGSWTSFIWGLWVNTQSPTHWWVDLNFGGICSFSAVNQGNFSTLKRLGLLVKAGPDPFSQAATEGGLLVWPKFAGPGRPVSPERFHRWVTSSGGMPYVELWVVLVVLVLASWALGGRFLQVQSYRELGDSQSDKTLT